MNRQNPHKWVNFQSAATGHISKYVAYQMELAGIDSAVAERESIRMINQGEA